MNTEAEIRIHLVSRSTPAWLRLQGTILTCREGGWFSQRTLDIPIELVRFSEHRRLKISRLAATVIVLALCASSGLLVPLLGLPETALGVMAMVTLVVFLVLLVRFFIPQKMMTIHVDPDFTPQKKITFRVDSDPTAISFWLEKRRASAIHALREEVKRRQSLVSEILGEPWDLAVNDTILSPGKRAAIATFLWCLPAFITEIPWLLLAGLIPLGQHLARVRQNRKEPREFRAATRLFYRRQWREALDCLDLLLRRQPDYLPGRLLQIELRMRLEDFVGAARVLSEIQHEFDAKTREALQRDLALRQKISQRKKEVPSAISGSAQP